MKYLFQITDWIGQKWYILQMLVYRNYLCLRLKRMGKNVLIDPSVYIINPSRVEIGDDVFINRNTDFVADKGTICIGSFVNIGPRVRILAETHAFDRWDLPMKYQGHTIGKVIIEDDVWIGGSATILPDVTVGRGSIVAAGAVVTHDVKPFTMVGGIPARFIKYRIPKTKIQKAIKLDLRSFTR